MGYEICRKLENGCWSAVAWADTKEWAEEICSCLNCLSEGKFSVRKENAMGSEAYREVLITGILGARKGDWPPREKLESVPLSRLEFLFSRMVGRTGREAAGGDE